MLTFKPQFLPSGQTVLRSGFLFTSALLGSLLSLVAAPVQAEEIFDNRGIRFDVDTIVEFEFVESHGAYQSTFGVVNLDTGAKTPLIQEIKPSDTPANVEVPSTFIDDTGRNTDFLGTPGNTVTQPLAEFEFKANTNYAFYLESFLNGKSEQIFYSVDTRNSNNSQRARFESGINTLGNGGMLLNWDDTGSLLVMQPEEDRDFDDFLVRVGGHLACVYDQVATAEGQPVAIASSQPAGFCKAQ
ncbi:MAG: DUF4114 domain-containing protein [Oculatellaceae cyanobacterium Prado106]|jgi:hypothetical protein|nr:DUF4114 domain-containing protein [Oculatellaceae cyanobacterium Prado106]